MIGLFNNIKFEGSKISPINMEDLLTCIPRYSHTCIIWLICKVLAIIFFPISITFLFLNLFPQIRTLFPTLENFSTFHTNIQIYIEVSFKFARIMITQNVPSLFNLKFYKTNWSFSSLLHLATMLAFLVLLGGNVHKNPGPLSFCHWNLGGLATDNFLMKFLLQAFLCVNDFDIVILGETHLTSKITNDDLNIEGYSFERIDYPNDDPRGGVGIYYKTSLPCMFKPELYKLKRNFKSFK